MLRYIINAALFVPYLLSKYFESLSTSMGDVISVNWVKSGNSSFLASAAAEGVRFWAVDLTGRIGMLHCRLFFKLKSFTAFSLIVSPWQVCRGHIQTFVSYAWTSSFKTSKPLFICFT